MTAFLRRRVAHGENVWVLIRRIIKAGFESHDEPAVQSHALAYCRPTCDLRHQDAAYDYPRTRLRIDRALAFS